MPEAFPRLASGAIRQQFFAGFSLPSQRLLHLQLPLRLGHFLTDRFGTVLVPQVNQFDRALEVQTVQVLLRAIFRLQLLDAVSGFLVQQLQMLVVTL